MPEPIIDEPEFTDEQLRAALRDVGEEARRAAFAGGRPVFLVRDNRLIAVYEDGTEQVIESLDPEAEQPRAGWNSAFQEMRRHDDDTLLDGDSPSLTSWDDAEWDW